MGQESSTSSSAVPSSVASPPAPVPPPTPPPTLAPAPTPAPAATTSPPTPETSPPAEPSGPLSSVGRIPIYVTGALAVVALGTGTVFGIMSISDHSSFDANPTTATANAGESHELIADMCFGGAATLAVAAIVMALTHEDPHPAAQSTPAPRASVSPVLSPRAAGVVVRF
jgi:hypothetical protein